MKLILALASFYVSHARKNTSHLSAYLVYCPGLLGYVAVLALPHMLGEQAEDLLILKNVSVYKLLC